jgi:hypothetical protein
MALILRFMLDTFNLHSSPEVQIHGPPFPTGIRDENRHSAAMTSPSPNSQGFTSVARSSARLDGPETKLYPMAKS